MSKSELIRLRWVNFHSTSVIWVECSYCCGGKEFIVDGGDLPCVLVILVVFHVSLAQVCMLIVVAQTVPGLSATVKHGSTNLPHAPGVIFGCCLFRDSCASVTWYCTSKRAKAQHDTCLKSADLSTPLTMTVLSWVKSYKMHLCVNISFEIKSMLTLTLVF